MERAAPTQLPVATLRRVLVATPAFFCCAGLAAELVRHGLAYDEPLVSAWSLSYEGNFPSWYASLLPLICAALLAWIAAGEGRDRGYWRALALGFLYISIDEAVSLHELLSTLFETEGVLRFGWVIPAAAVVLTVGLSFVGFLRRLDREVAGRFILAGAIYVTGAVVFELPLGWWTEHHGDDSFGYAMIDWCEETLEFAGLTLFASTLLGRLLGRSLVMAPAPAIVGSSDR